jgi:hypothetical protein
VTTTDTDPIKSDPAVIAAESRRDAAREAYDLVNETWTKAAGTRSITEMRGNANWAQMAALKEAEADATRLRDRAWSQVVQANNEIARAHAAARYRQDLAEHTTHAA